MAKILGNLTRLLTLRGVVIGVSVNVVRHNMRGKYSSGSGRGGRGLGVGVGEKG